ncbi:hypothetical protein ACIGB8_27880 [Promicromonospora sukumoe]|uniref:hypothetical protein n=1 Tax=Promicromonospora sukumoe TaxID=88382 RepID=UPI0037C8D87D
MTTKDMMNPAAKISKVIADQLAHGCGLLSMSDTALREQIMDLLVRVMPGYAERKRELAQRGEGLWFGAMS